MTTEPMKQPSFLTTKLTTFVTIVGFLASIAAIIGVFIQLRSESRKLEVQVLSSDQLTSLPNVVGLSGEFFYKDVPVVDLWRLRIQFLNTGDVTLVGEGTSSMLLQNNILVQFPHEVTILDIDNLSGDFYSLNKSSENGFTISFTQWRKSEQFEVVIYLTANKKLNTAPLPLISGRPLIDGDVIITPLLNQNNLQSQVFLDRLPAPIPLVGRLLGILFTLATSILTVLFLFDGVKDYIKQKKWKQEHFKELITFLDSINLTGDDRKKALEKPWTLRYNTDDEYGKETAYKIYFGDGSKSFRESIPYARVNRFSVFLLMSFGIIGVVLVCLGIIAGLIRL